MNWWNGFGSCIVAGILCLHPTIFLKEKVPMSYIRFYLNVKFVKLCLFGAGDLVCLNIVKLFIFIIK